MLRQATGIDNEIGAFCARVHAARVRRGFNDNMHITRNVVLDVFRNIELQHVLEKKRQPSSDKMDRIRDLLANPSAKNLFFKKAILETPIYTDSRRHAPIDYKIISILKGRSLVWLLDIACGFDASQQSSPATMATIKRFNDAGCLVDAVAVDMRANNRRTSRNMNIITYVKMDLFDKRVSDLGKFDIVKCLNVLYYYNGSVAQAAVESMKATLAPGGILIEDSKTVSKPVITMHIRSRGSFEQRDITKEVAPSSRKI